MVVLRFKVQGTKLRISKHLLSYLRTSSLPVCNFIEPVTVYYLKCRVYELSFPTSSIPFNYRYKIFKGLQTFAFLKNSKAKTKLSDLVVLVVIAWEIPLSKIQLGAYGSQSDNGFSDLAVVMDSPCDQQVMLSMVTITGVVNLSTRDVA